MSDETLANFKSEGTGLEDFLQSQITDEEQETETPESSPDEEQTTDNESPSQEGEESDDESTEKSEDESDDNTPDETDNVPFHKHPRWKQRQQEMEELKSQNEKLSDELRQFVKAQTNSNQEFVPDDEFKYLFGDNPEAYKKFKGMTEKYAKELVDEQINSFKQEQERIQEQTQKWEQHMENTLSELSIDNNVKLSKSDRNEIYKMALDIRPTDSDGNISIEKTFELWNDRREKPSAEKKKRVASLSTTKDKAKAAVKEYMTSDDLKGPWDKFAR
jgi:hypothetical protein